MHTMRRRSGFSAQDFERAIDEFFDEMLISRWRAAAPEEFERSQVLDLPDAYQLRIAIPGADPKTIAVEMSGQKLCVRAPAGREGSFESAYSFAVPVDEQGVEANWAAGVLTVRVPKQKPRIIKVSH